MNVLHILYSMLHVVCSVSQRNNIATYCLTLDLACTPTITYTSWRCLTHFLNKFKGINCFSSFSIKITQPLLDLDRIVCNWSRFAKTRLWSGFSSFKMTWFSRFSENQAFSRFSKIILSRNNLFKGLYCSSFCSSNRPPVFHFNYIGHLFLLKLIGDL